ncbi:MAG: CoxG family protein [Ramlibacter sp.]
MDMQGSRVLAASRQQAWEALNDPEVLKACIPGCDKVEPAGENQYAIGMAVKVGPVSSRFGGKIQLLDVQPPSSYTLRFEGQGGAAGFGKGTSKVRLEPHDPGCELHYTVNAQVGGRIAQVGQRLIDGVARSMAEEFFKRFDAEMQRRHPGAAAVDAPAAMTATQGPAATPAKGSGVPRWVWVVAVVVIAGVAWWMLR